MHLHPSPPSSLFFMITLIFILIHIPLFVHATDEQFLNCSKTFQCANMQNIDYPFWGGNRPDYCGHPGFQRAESDSVFRLQPNSTQALEGNSYSSTSLKAALDGGFGLQWSANSDLCSQCVTSGGQCGYESGSSSFTCFCSDKAYASSCSATQNAQSFQAHNLHETQIFAKIETVEGNSLMRILNIAAFAVSGYSCTEGRNCKPFNPLLGETYEAAYPDNGLRFISEKDKFVSGTKVELGMGQHLKLAFIAGNAFRPGVNPISIHNVQHYVNGQVVIESARDTLESCSKAQTDSYQEEVAVA
ncbi:hypothetical protein TEA_025974 [Camellia sinensis var. sinensis]|uniref:non-specific serine/threonine protein kinase n=1 Tax=Camellia sinensis var. sinensis TaxID=542762 RepID=A0A4S4EK89_CAMSN|nr:hypothetical protein TEA_025974 [Camellia sinensis var. sinensis]